MKLSKNLMIAVLLSSVGLSSSVPKTLIQPAFANDDKVTICHRTDAVNNPYVKITVDDDSVDGDSGNDNGQGDHALEHVGPVAYSEKVAQELKDQHIEWGDIIPPHHNFGGLNWDENGQMIYNNGCGYPVINPSPEPTVEPTPTPTIGPVDPTPTPTIGPVDPTPEPTSKPAENDVKVRFSTIDPTCDSNTVTAIEKITVNNVDQSGVRVVFRYNGVEKVAYTDAHGEALVRFDYTGDGFVDVSPDGYASEAHRITKQTECSVNNNGNNDGQVLGASTQGQVLGATTYAETGVVEDVMMSILGLVGASMFTTGAVLHVKNKS